MQNDIQSATITVTETAMTTLTEYGLDVIGAIILLIVGYMAAGWTKRLAAKALNRVHNLDMTLASLGASTARYLVLMITVIAVLGQFGIETASFIAILGTAGLAIGLAMQGTLSNVAAGVMLLLFRPFSVGDFIEGGGVAGTVKSLDLFSTELATVNNLKVIVPNGQMWGTAITNYSANETRRIDFILGIGYDDNIDEAMVVINQVIDDEARIIAEPARLIAVDELADSSVNLVVRVWSLSSDALATKLTLNKQFKESFDRAGINIPYPQMVIHKAGG